MMGHYMGEDLTPLSLQDVTSLEQQLELSLCKVRLRKVSTESEQFDQCMFLNVSVILVGANTLVSANSKSCFTGSCLKCATGYAEFVTQRDLCFCFRTIEL